MSPSYNFPEAKFARLNNDEEQITHILSEANEVAEAVLFGTNVDLELADLTHSLETYWRKKERLYGPAHVNAIFDRVISKNNARGYYAITEEVPGMSYITVIERDNLDTVGALKEALKDLADDMPLHDGFGEALILEVLKDSDTGDLEAGIR